MIPPYASSFSFTTKNYQLHALPPINHVSSECGEGKGEEVSGLDLLGQADSWIR